MGLFGKKKKEPEIEFGFPAAEKRKEIVPLPPPPQKPITPQPIEARPVARVPQQVPEIAPAPEPEVPKLEEKPIVPVAMPEEIKPPEAPPIQRLRPHVFLKISKYKEVMTSIDEILGYIKELRKNLKDVLEIEEKESLKVKESEELIVRLGEIAGIIDKIFSNPEK